jgi:hypothetical protein
MSNFTDHTRVFMMEEYILNYLVSIFSRRFPLILIFFSKDLGREGMMPGFLPPSLATRLYNSEVQICGTS